MGSRESGYSPQGHESRATGSWATGSWATGSRGSSTADVAAHTTLHTLTGVTRAKDGSGGGVGTRSLGWGRDWTQPCTPGASSLGNPLPAWPSESSWVLSAGPAPRPPRASLGISTGLQGLQGPRGRGSEAGHSWLASPTPQLVSEEAGEGS